MGTARTIGLKLLLTPGLIGLASWAGRRRGPEIGGLFAALPLTSGPVLLLLAIERGPSFAVRACAGTIVATISLAGFALAYAWSARRFGWLLSGLLSWTAYLIVTMFLRYLTVGLLAASVLSCAALFLAWKLIPKKTAVVVRRASFPGDLILRMLLAVLLVWTITAAANALGPTLSGLLTPFPIAGTLLAAFTHHADGAVAASQLLRSLLGGLYSFVLFFLILGSALQVADIGSSFVAASVGSLLLHSLLGWQTKRVHDEPATTIH
jgi:hypothetical protein